MTTIVIEKWTDDQCRLLEPLWDLSRARRDAHHIAYRFYNKWHTVVNLPTILLGAILSTLSLKPEAVPPGISAGLAIFITGMSTVNTFFEFSKSREGHRQCYRAFNAIVRDIELNIIRGREDPKRSFVDYLETANDQFNRVVEGAPTLNKIARNHLDAYRGARPSPFDQLLKGDKKVTGATIGDVFDEREPYVESVDGDSDGDSNIAISNTILNGSSSKNVVRFESNVNRVKSSSPAQVPTVHHNVVKTTNVRVSSGDAVVNEKHLESNPRDLMDDIVIELAQTGNVFPDTVALNVFNEQVAKQERIEMEVEAYPDIGDEMYADAEEVNDDNKNMEVSNHENNININSDDVIKKDNENNTDSRNKRGKKNNNRNI